MPDKLNYDYLNKLRQEKYSKSRDYDYSVKYLNSAITESQRCISDINSSNIDYTEEKRPELSYLSEQFLNLVETAKDYYDSKAESEKINKEYKRLARILELEESIGNYIRWISNANYTDYNEPLENDFNELINLIK
ncbi:MAG: hypothetical protein IJ193_00555 [Bacilli bacterium]|nr:hypothetical protein [Bacilli bacterium]